MHLWAAQWQSQIRATFPPAPEQWLSGRVRRDTIGPMMCSRFAHG
jgi:hypothetical protein